MSRILYNTRRCNDYFLFLERVIITAVDGGLRHSENQVRLTWVVCSASSSSIGTLGCLLLLKLERFRGRENYGRIGNAIVLAFFWAFNLFCSMFSTLFTILLLHSSVYIGISARLARFYVT